VKLCVKKGLKFGSKVEFPTQCSSSQQPVRSSNFWPKNSITEVEYPSYSPDLPPNDFLLFTKMKSILRGRKFQDTEDIKKCDDGTERYSTTGVPNISNSAGIVGLSAQLFNGIISKVTAPSNV
jgi:hypothetical protein